MRLPVGLITIAACLRRERTTDDLVIIDECVANGTAYSESNLAAVCQSIVKKTLAFKPDLVGFTATTADFHHVLYLAGELKKHSENIITLVGGPHATLAGEEFFTHSDDIDFVFIGEGEWLFAEFIDCLDGKAPFPERGIWRKADYKASRRPGAEIVENLKDLPVPAYDLLDMERYTAPCIMTIRPLLFSSICLFSSRGCPFQCTFCASGTVWGRKIRHYDPKRVVDEIEHVKNNYHIDAFFFYDEVFTLNCKHVLALCNELKIRRIGLPWGCETRVDCIDEEIYETIRSAGCIQVEFGIEAGNEKGWKRIRKNIGEPQVIKAFDLARRCGLRTLANYMVNKEDETLEDLEDICKLIGKTRPTTGLTNIMTPYPGTPIAESRGGIPVSDYGKLNTLDFNEFINFLESKWRFAAHDLPLTSAVQKINFAFKKSPFAILMALMDWFYGRLQIGIFLKSRKKTLYLSALSSIMKSKFKRYTVLAYTVVKDRFRVHSG